MAAENFARCLAFVLQWEGGFVNDPRDPGGATNMGVTRATLSRWRGRPVSVAEVQRLTRDEATKIYRARYWAPISGDALPVGVDLIALDIAVNMGVSRALTWLHQTGDVPAGQRDDALATKRVAFWRGLQTWAVYGRGWSRRGAACLALANQMQHEAA